MKTLNISSIEDNIIQESFINSQNELLKLQDHMLFKRYTFLYKDIIKVDSFVMNNNKVYPSRGKKFIGLPINPLPNAYRDRFYKSELYGNKKTLIEYHDLGIFSTDIFINGLKLHNSKTVAIIMDNFTYIEVDDNFINHICVLVYNYDVIMKSYNVENQPDIELDKANGNIMCFIDGKLSENYILDSNRLYINNIFENVDIVYCDSFQIVNLHETGVTNIAYNAIGVPVHTNMVFNFNVDGMLNTTSGLRFNYVYDGLIKSNITTYGNIIIFNHKSKRNYDTMIDRYVKYFNYINESINGSLPIEITDFKPFYIDRKHITEANREVNIHNIISHKRENYSKFIDRIMKNSFTFNYNDINDDLKSIKNTNDYSEHELQEMKFYEDRFLVSFKCGTNKFFNIYYNGILISDKDVYYFVNNKVAYCFLNKNDFIDIESGLFEVEVNDYIGYDRVDKIASYDDDCTIQLSTIYLEDIDTMRFYINGMLVPKNMIRIVSKKGSLEEYTFIFKISIKIGDVLTAETFPFRINTILHSDKLKSDTIQIDRMRLDFPLDIRYYDIYVNGKKLLSNESISTTTIKLLNVESSRHFLVRLKPELHVLSSKYRDVFFNAPDKWVDIVDKLGVYEFVDVEYVTDKIAPIDAHTEEDYMIYYHALFNLFLEKRSLYAENMDSDIGLTSNFNHLSVYNAYCNAIPLDASMPMLRQMIMTDRADVYNNSKQHIDTFIDATIDTDFDITRDFETDYFIEGNVVPLSAFDIIDKFTRIPGELLEGDGYEYIIEESESV